MKKNLLLFLVFGLLLAVAIYFYANQRSSTLSQPLTDFAIEDTASINRIFISDTENNTILLDRSADGWTVNGTYKARKDAVELLLKTFHRIRVKAPVPKPAVENTLRQLAAKHKKVEIYTGESTPEKTYYVGHPTQDHFGTFMLLETDEHGKSSEPFITYMSGFSGFLSSRFFTNLNDWRHTGVFNYDPSNIRQIDVSIPKDPEKAFSVKLNDAHELLLLDRQGKNIDSFDTLALQDFVLLFQKLHFETANTHLSDTQIDSVLDLTPNWTITITDQQNEQKEVSVFLKKVTGEVYDDLGRPVVWDQDRLYAKINGNELVLIQTYTWGRVLVEKNFFLR